MIRILEFSKVRPEEILNRAIQTETEVDEIVAGILADVRENGDAALRKYAEKFDGAALDSLEVAPEEIEAGYAAADPEFIRTLEMAAANIREFHQKQVRNDFALTRADGVLMAAKYGEKLAVGVDARNGFVSVSGWTEDSNFAGVGFCRRLRDAGVKTVIYTDISRDGAEKGANLEIYRELVKLENLAVTASGGISSVPELRELKEIGVAAAILGKALYTGRIDLAEAMAAAEEA